MDWHCNGIYRTHIRQHLWQTTETEMKVVDELHSNDLHSPPVEQGEQLIDSREEPHFQGCCVNFQWKFLKTAFFLIIS